MHYKKDGLARHRLFIAYLQYLVWQKRGDAIIVVIGPRGSGKSTTVYDIAKSVDRDFSLQRNIYYNIDAYLNFISTTPPRGSVPVFDDLATATDTTKWYDDFNRALIRVGQFGGSFGYITFFVAPNLSGILSGIRYQADFIIMMDSEREWAGWYNIRWGKISPNLSHPSIWFPYFARQFRIGDASRTVRFKECYSPQMSDAEYRTYEEFKESFTRPAVLSIARDAKKKKLRKEGIRTYDQSKDTAYY